MNVRSFDCDNARCWEAAQVNGFDSWNYGCMAKCESRDLWRGEHSVMRVPARLGYSPAICFGGEDRRCRNEQHVSRPKRSGREIADWARSRGCEADGVLAGNRTGTRRSEGRQVIQSPRWCPNFVQCYLNLLSHRQPIMNPNSPSCLPNSTLPCEQNDPYITRQTRSRTPVSSTRTTWPKLPCHPTASEAVSFGQSFPTTKSMGKLTFADSYRQLKKHVKRKEPKEGIPLLLVPPMLVDLFASFNGRNRWLRR